MPYSRRERSEHRRELGRRRVRQCFHGKLEVAERCPLAGRRCDGGGHLVAGQPGGLQSAGAPLARADVRVYGDIAADGVLELVPVEQPQVTFLGVVERDGGLILQRVIDRAEHGPIGLHGSGHDQLRLEQPRGVGIGRRFLLRVHQAKLDDVLTVASRADLCRQVHVRPGQRVPPGRVLVEPDVYLPPDRLPAPLPVRVSRLVQDVGLDVLTPGHRDGKDVYARGDHAGQPHGRRPHAARVLHGKQVGQLRIGTIAAGHHVRIDRRGLFRALLGRAWLVPRAQPPDKVTLPWALRSRRENLILAIPRAQQVPLQELLQRVPDQVGGSGFKLLRRVGRRWLPVRYDWRAPVRGWPTGYSFSHRPPFHPPAHRFAPTITGGGDILNQAEVDVIPLAPVLRLACTSTEHLPDASKMRRSG